MLANLDWLISKRNTPRERRMERLGKLRKIVGDHRFEAAAFKQFGLEGRAEADAYPWGGYEEWGENVVPFPKPAPLEADRLVEITVFRSTDEPLGKTMRLDEHGKVMKTPDANMWKGFATRTPVNGAGELRQVILQIGKFESPTLGRLRAGLPDTVEVTTKARLKGSTGFIARDCDHLEYLPGQQVIVLLDYDTHDKPAKIVVKDFWRVLLKVCPALRNAERVTRASTSAGLYNLKTGKNIPGSSGVHIYIWAEDGSDVERFLTALFERAWLLGFGWIMIAANGDMLERSIIDKTVDGPERFAFEAPPTLKPPLAQRAERRDPVAIKGEVIDTRTACPSLDANERARFNELVAAEKAKRASEAAKVKAAYDEAQIARLVKKGVPKEKAERQVEAMHHEVLNSDTVLLFKTLGECTVKDVLKNPERFHSEYCGDPAEPSLPRDKAQVIQRRNDGWPWIKVYAHGVPDGSYSLRYTDEDYAELSVWERPRVDEAYAFTAELMKRKEKPEAEPSERVSDNKPAGSEKVVPLKTKLMIEMICAAEVKMKSKDWLWFGHLLRGALQLMTGQPGLGKSQVQIHFMACVTSGLVWPDGEPGITPMNVIMVTAEDAIDSDVVPRLTAAGANLSRVHIIKCIRTDKEKRQFLLAEDLEKLEQAIAHIGDVALVCIDPITAFMGGKTDAHKTTEVRSQLGPLKDLSERTHVAISAITHPAKNAGTRAIDHFIASQAFIAAARIGHACFEELDLDEATGEKTPTGRTLFTHVKHSGSRKMPTLAYRIEPLDIQPEPFVRIETTRVVWEKETVNISADQAVAFANKSGKAKEKEEEPAGEVVDFLRMMLDAGKGWCKQTEVAAQAKALGFSDKEMRTARKKLNVISKKDGFDGPWMWGWEGRRPIRF